MRNSNVKWFSQNNIVCNARIGMHFNAMHDSFQNREFNWFFCVCKKFHMYAIRAILLDFWQNRVQHNSHHDCSLFMHKHIPPSISFLFQFQLFFSSFLFYLHEALMFVILFRQIDKVSHFILPMQILCNQYVRTNHLTKWMGKQIRVWFVHLWYVKW